MIQHSSSIVPRSHLFFYSAHTYDMQFGMHMDRHRPNISGVPDDFNVCIFCCSRNLNKAMLSSCSLSSLSPVCQNEHPKMKHSEASHFGVWRCLTWDWASSMISSCLCNITEMFNWRIRDTGDQGFRHLYFSICSCLSSSRGFGKEKDKVCFSSLPPFMSWTRKLRC